MLNSYLSPKIAKIKSVLSNILFSKAPVVFVSESADWVIKEICKENTNVLNTLIPNSAEMSSTYIGLHDRLLHFGTIYPFAPKGIPVSFHPSNKVVLTWYHIVDNDPKNAMIPVIDKAVQFFHVACTITKNKLLAHGVDEKKIVLIPESIDTHIFTSVSFEEKISLRKKFGIPTNKIIIGSFQKDGVGWGDGMEPKPVKGPDIFCDVVIELAKKYPVHVLLTGPARGYVKQRLSENNIPFTHVYLDSYYDIVPYYQMLDLYIVASREEGGPKAILECFATGVALVTTRVGMAPDVVVDGENGFLVEVEDRDALIQKTSVLIEDATLREQFSEKAKRDAVKYSHEAVMRQYIQKLYQPLGYFLDFK